MKYQPLTHLQWKSAVLNTLGFLSLCAMFLMASLILLGWASHAVGSTTNSKLIIHVDVWCATFDGEGCDDIDPYPALRRIDAAAEMLDWPRSKYVAHFTGGTRVMHCSPPTPSTGMQCGLDMIIEEIRFWDKGPGNYVMVAIVGPATAQWANDLYGTALYPFPSSSPHWTTNGCALWSVAGSDLQIAIIAHELTHCTGLAHYEDGGETSLMSANSNPHVTHRREHTIARKEAYFGEKTETFSLDAPMEIAQ